MDIPKDIISNTSLLYVEDDELTQELVIEILRFKFQQITLYQANNGRDGLNLYVEKHPHIVITDIRMPIMDGIAMARQIKEIDKDSQIIILSAIDEIDYILEAIDIGINNYVLKPLKMEKFVAAVERCLNNICLREQLKQKEEYISSMAYYDFLTGLPNRQLLTEFLHKSVANAQRHNRCLSLLSLDLDGFKSVNDTLGHAAGDALLKGVAQRLLSCCRRDQDTVARWGGDEFIVLLTDLNGAHEALSVAQQIITAFEQPFTVHGQALTIGISIGIAFFPDNGTDEETLIRNADTAMYCAKKNWPQPVSLLFTL
ncbi:signaling protein YkoW [Geobacter sp. OR-1]|uniref:diguanylate cyclase domain-containing protein n=1 Tax=Geobacter sp. OR-1 TaxID=1266765 RepID=UPI000542871B|nr:diguanylate cyclase [Geobacter sp. OR-1]GAM10220.1 signaling protein YkoW [Geobacter sp. OR-1]